MVVRIVIGLGVTVVALAIAAIAVWVRKLRQPSLRNCFAARYGRLP